MNMIDNRISELRKVMKEHGIDAYYVPTEDWHLSEYVGDHYKCRQFITGFTGSAGSAVVTQDSACLWVDGRYFIQGEEQTRGTCVTLYKMGEPGVPSVHKYLADTLKEGQCLGFDARTVSRSEEKRFAAELKKSGAVLAEDLDLVGEIWEDRPPLTCTPVYELGLEWCGESRADKLRSLRVKMREKDTDGIVVSPLDDIAWLLNLRGNDVPCNPVILSYLYVSLDSAVFFAQKGAVPEEVKESLQKDGVECRDYEDVYDYFSGLREKSVWLTEELTNARLALSLPDGIHTVNEDDPVRLMKAVKNPVEMENMRQAHLLDGAAVFRFIIWLKQNVGKTEITEISAAEKLLSFRREQDHFMGESFAPIIAYGSHAAICHYSATVESDRPLEPKGMVLADTGGQYLLGTTDITRTIVLGPVTEEEKKYFTLVLKGHLHLMNAKFREGVTGLNLDYIAREPLWRIGKDYNHGTGHGVGYFLNVHEGPNGFRWREMAGRRDTAAFCEGMITSDEPGYYAEGQFGVRHENLILCRKAEKSDNIQYMEFEPLTMVPFDLDGIDAALLGEEDTELLNRYHRLVYEKLSPLLNDEERGFLADATREIKKV